MQTCDRLYSGDPMEIVRQGKRGTSMIPTWYDQLVWQCGHPIEVLAVKATQQAEDVLTLHE